MNQARLYPSNYSSLRHDDRKSATTAFGCCCWSRSLNRYVKTSIGWVRATTQLSGVFKAAFHDTDTEDVRVVECGLCATDRHYVERQAAKVDRENYDDARSWSRHIMALAMHTRGCLSLVIVVAFASSPKHACGVGLGLDLLDVMASAADCLTSWDSVARSIGVTRYILVMIN